MERYHPHFPGATTLHAGGGAVGMLIVEDLDVDLPSDILNLPDVNMRIQFLNFTYLQQDYATGQSYSYVTLCQQFCLSVLVEILSTLISVLDGKAELLASAWPA